MRFKYETAMHENRDSIPGDEISAHLKRVVDYIQDHCREDLSLNRLAEVAHFSKFHFHRLFRERFGETIHCYLKRSRLEQAAHRLATDANASIAEVADVCGFSSSQNFARAFKTHFGFPPSSVRKHSGQHEITKTVPLSEPPKKKPSLTVEITEEPSHCVAYVRDIGPYRSKSNDRAIERLFQWAVTAGHADTCARLAGVYWSDIETTPPYECMFDACLTVPENVKGDGEVRIQTLPGGKQAVLHCEDKWDQIPAQRKWLLSEWLPTSGYIRDERPLYFIYYNNPYMNRLKLTIVDICLPIKP
jgi:AraC family transcriptional regulator